MRAHGSILGLVAFALAAPITADAANRYVRQGASGNGSGSDWTNAYGSLPSTLVRGDTYYVADGSYGSHVFDDSGTAVITIKKATEADHGTSVGWQSGYGDGQATFGDLRFTTGYYTIDGQRRNEANWQDGAAYGFRIVGTIYSSSLNPGPSCADNLTVRYADIGGSPIGNTYSAGNPSEAFYFGGFGDVCNNWTIQRNHIHNITLPFQIAGGDGHLIEYNWIGPAFGKEAIRGQVRASNLVIRFNVFKDSCQFTPGDSSSGCTAEIALWDGGGSGSFSNNLVYGNVFQKTTTQNNSGGVVVIGGNGSSWVGTSASNSVILNNTIVGFKDGNAMLLINGGSGNVIRNNLYYDIASHVSTACSANTCSNNVKATSSPFVAYPNNLRLTGPTAAGTALSAPYNLDLYGSARGADGVWDLGAFEFASGSPGLPAPTLLRIVGGS